MALRATRVGILVLLLVLLCLPAEALAARNGRFILFSSYDQNSPYEVFRIRVGGGHLRKLARGFEPVWSPDGERIAFTGNGVTVMRKDGSGRRPLATGDEPQWSPHGRRLVYRRWKGREFHEWSAIYVIRRNGKGKHRIARGQEKAVERPAWSPDGRWISYVKSKVFVREGEDFSEGLWIVSPRGEHRRRVLVRREFSWAGYDWSPDGSRIVFTCRCHGRDQEELYVVHVASGEVTRITDTPGSELDPDWSPDGNRIVYVRWRAGGMGFAKLMTVRPDGSDASVLQSRMRGHPDPSWSPNSRKIAYIPGEFNDIWVIDADGSDRRRVTSDPRRRDHVDASWQPR